MNKFLLLLVLFSSIATTYAYFGGAPGMFTMKQTEKASSSPKHTTVQGCPPQKYSPYGTANENAKEGAVRCCGKDGICVSPESCDEKVTYEKAKAICEGLSKELCTKQQMTLGRCCRTGCGFDLKATWVQPNTWET